MSFKDPEVVDHGYFIKICVYGEFDVWFKEGIGYFIVKSLNGVSMRLNPDILNSIDECKYIIEFHQDWLLPFK